MKKAAILLVTTALVGAIMFIAQPTRLVKSQPQPPPVVFKTEVKFLCGFIETFQPSPPLGLGRYKTAIGVINPDISAYLQPRAFSWKAVVDDGPTSGVQTVSLGPDAATEIDCNDIVSSLPGGPTFQKGYVVFLQIIPLPVTPPVPFPTTIAITPAYTYEDPRNKIIFKVSLDPSGLVPAQDLKKRLEFIAPMAQLETVINVDTLVRSHLKVIDWHGLSDAQVDALKIKIIDVQLGVGSSLVVERNRVF